MKNYETYINNFRFKYDGENLIEVYTSDSLNPVHRIALGKPLDDEKSFQKECSFWFMEEAYNYND